MRCGRTENNSRAKKHQNSGARRVDEAHSFTFEIHCLQQRHLPISDNDTESSLDSPNERRAAPTPTHLPAKDGNFLDKIHTKNTRKSEQHGRNTSERHSQQSSHEPCVEFHIARVQHVGWEKIIAKSEGRETR